MQKCLWYLSNNPDIKAIRPFQDADWAVISIPTTNELRQRIENIELYGSQPDLIVLDRELTEIYREDGENSTLDSKPVDYRSLLETIGTQPLAFYKPLVLPFAKEPGVNKEIIETAINLGQDKKKRRRGKIHISLFSELGIDPREKLSQNPDEVYSLDRLAFPPDHDPPPRNQELWFFTPDPKRSKLEPFLGPGWHVTTMRDSVHFKKRLSLLNSKDGKRRNGANPPSLIVWGGPSDDMQIPEFLRTLNEYGLRGVSVIPFANREISRYLYENREQIYREFGVFIVDALGPDPLRTLEGGPFNGFRTEVTLYPIPSQTLPFSARK